HPLSRRRRPNFPCDRPHCRGSLALSGSRGVSLSHPNFGKRYRDSPRRIDYSPWFRGLYATEMVELPGQFAVRGGIVDVFSPEAARPVRIELLGDTVESVREFDARTQRSIAPVVRTTFLPLTEWSLPAPEQADLSAAAWETPSYFGPASEPGPSTLFELA